MQLASIIGLVFLGGGLGSLARFGIGRLSLRFYEGNFPLGTLLANTLACVLLGAIIYFYKDKLTQIEWIKYLIVIGFCGGFSTFSTFSYETVVLFQDHQYLLGVANIMVSLVLGIGILLLLVK